MGAVPIRRASSWLSSSYKFNQGGQKPPFIIYIMDLNIKTKFDVGQSVFILKKETVFKEGNFVSINIADPNAYIVTSIRTHTYKDYQSVYYRLDGHKHSFREDMVFASYDEAKQNE